MTHPDIKYIERYGYTRGELERGRPVGICLFCGSEVFQGDEGFIKSFDGLFCNSECCHNYYEIDSQE